MATRRCGCIGKEAASWPESRSFPPTRRRHEVHQTKIKKPSYPCEDETLVLNFHGTSNAKRDALGKVKGYQLCVSDI